MLLLMRLGLAFASRRVSTISLSPFTTLVKMMKTFINKDVVKGDKEIVETLLDANANPSLMSNNNETAYSLAITSGRKLVALIIAEATVLRR